jgi:diphthamide synthase (EF-2-diphthine--ammonia ligase)
MEMGRFAIEATKREIHNHQIAWTTDHWTGADKGTYTTVTHWINNATWRLHSACLDFKVFEGSTTGERIYEDIKAVLQKYQGEAEDTIVFDIIGITDTTGNMGKLCRYLHDNGKEHGYCMDHNLHLVAKLAFEREIVCVLMCFHLL